MLTQIINGRILTPQGWLRNGSVILRDGKILEVTNCDLAVIGAELIDAKGMYVVPGFIEMHVHGGGGSDFQEGTEEAFRTAVQAHAKYGTTSIFPTLSSSTVPMIEKAVATCDKLMKEKDSPIMGLHLEGHYLNPNKAGAQVEGWLKNPDPNEYIPIVEHSACLARWDAAPELPGALQFGKYCSEKGVLPSIAHTNAEYSDVRGAFEVGFTHVTHFYNAMPGFHNKQGYKYEGTVESVYLIDDMTIECVADGIHVPPTILRMACLRFARLCRGRSLQAGWLWCFGWFLCYIRPSYPHDGAAGRCASGGCCEDDYRHSRSYYGYSGTQGYPLSWQGCRHRGARR